MKHSMADTLPNRRKLARFVAQEVAKDHKIPHFTKSAVESIILEAGSSRGWVLGRVKSRRAPVARIAAGGDGRMQREEPGTPHRPIRPSRLMLRLSKRSQGTVDTCGLPPFTPQPVVDLGLFSIRA